MPRATRAKHPHVPWSWPRSMGVDRPQLEAHDDTITNQAGSGAPWHCWELVRHAPYTPALHSNTFLI